MNSELDKIYAKRTTTTSKIPNINTDDTIVFNIDNRTVNTDGAQDIIVQHDNNSRTISFRIQRHFEATDLSTKSVSIRYTTPMGESDESFGRNRIAETDYITFDWVVSNKATSVSGDLQFDILFYDDNGYGWHTKSAILVVEKGLKVTTITPKPSQDWIDSWRAEAGNILIQCANAAQFEQNAKAFSMQAGASSENAESAQNAAKNEADRAQDAAVTSQEMVTQAQGLVDSVVHTATLSQSYANGGTGTREGEDTDNAKYYMERAQEVVGGDFATNEQAQGYVTRHDESIQAHIELFGGKADLVDGKVTTAQLPAMNYDSSGSAATALTNAKAYANSKVSTVAAALDAHGHTATDVGADPTGSAATALTNSKAYTDTKTADAMTQFNNLATVVDTLADNVATITDKLCTLEITCAPSLQGKTITVTKGATVLSQIVGATLKVTYQLPELGTWSIYNSSTQKTETINADYYGNYYFTINPVKIYGISRTVASSSVTWSRTDDSVGKTATASVGTAAGTSGFNNCYPWSEMKRETLSTGDIMVKIPAFYFQRYVESGVEHIRIADKATEGFVKHPGSGKHIGAYKTSSNNKSVSGVAPTVSQARATMRTNAKAKGSGWSLIDKAAESAVQMLLLIEFATNNAQTAIGRGYCDGNSAALSVGSCNTVPNLTGRPSGTDGKTDVVYRGIEGFWGNIWEWVDGINVNDGTYYVCTDPTRYADDTASYYTALGYKGDVNWRESYITAEGMDVSVPWAMLASAAGSGSETIYYTDACWSSTGWRVYSRSGNWNNGSLCGFFTVFLSYASSGTSANVGSRLLYSPS